MAMERVPTQSDLPSPTRRILRGGALALAWLMALGCAAWAIGALWFDLPALRTTGVLLFVGLVLGTVIFARGAWRKVGCVMCGFVIVLAWWWTLKPGSDRPWQADVTQT